MDKNRLESHCCLVLTACLQGCLSYQSGFWQQRSRGINRPVPRAQDVDTWMYPRLRSMPHHQSPTFTFAAVPCNLLLLPSAQCWATTPFQPHPCVLCKPVTRFQKQKCNRIGKTVMMLIAFNLLLFLNTVLTPGTKASAVTTTQLSALSSDEPKTKWSSACWFLFMPSTFQPSWKHF